MTRPEYIIYLETDLIPDLKEVGLESTAEDFETILYVLKNDNLPKQHLKDYNWKEPSDFIDYLDDVFIPDLLIEGCNNTVDDLQTGIRLMEEVVSC